MLLKLRLGSIERTAYPRLGEYALRMDETPGRWMRNSAFPAKRLSVQSKLCCHF